MKTVKIGRIIEPFVKMARHDEAGGRRINIPVPCNEGDIFSASDAAENRLFPAVETNPLLYAGRKTDEQMKYYFDRLKRGSYFKEVAPHILRGPHANEAEFVLLKEAGIKSVIDLQGNPDYKDLCEKNGLGYVRYVWHDLDRDILGSLAWDSNFKRPQAFVESLIKFNDTINEGDCAMGCRQGTTRTDIALILSQFFNPQDKQFVKATIYSEDLPESTRNGVYFKVCRAMKGLAKLLTEDDKVRLGWTEDFEQKFNTKIEQELLEIKQKRSL